MSQETLPDKRPREAKKTHDSTFDRIYKFHFSKFRVELTDKEKEICERWDYCFKLICNMHSERNVVRVLMSKFDIGKSKAYDDLFNTRVLFGDKNVNKEFKRLVSEEWIMWGMKLAKKEKNLEALDKLIARYNKINGLEIESDNEFADMVKKLTPTALVFTLDAKQLQQEADGLMDKIPSVDTDYEDVSDEGKG